MPEVGQLTKNNYLWPQTKNFLVFFVYSCSHFIALIRALLTSFRAFSAMLSVVFRAF